MLGAEAGVSMSAYNLRFSRLPVLFIHRTLSISALLQSGIRRRRFIVLLVAINRPCGHGVTPDKPAGTMVGQVPVCRRIGVVAPNGVVMLSL
jgi:hypothetical protein